MSSDQAPPEPPTGAPAEVVLKVVGVGASAGGLAAIRAMFGALPAETGLAFVLVQHLDPSAQSLLVDLLAPNCALTVVEATDGAPLTRDTVHIAPPGVWLTVDGDRLRVQPMQRRAIPSSIDRLLFSLAESHGADAAGVLLSGDGNDGAAGLRAIRAVGGCTIAQDPATAAHPGLPQSAIDAGAVDLVLAADAIGPALLHFRDQPRYPRNDAAPEPALDGDDRADLSPEGLPEEGLKRLTALLRAHDALDLDQYKAGTVRRRIRRRMGLIGAADFESYLDRLRRDGAERQQLLRDLLIGVTEFFRDPQAWQTLRTQAVDELVRRARPGETLRIWVAGCSTGEEAYTAAMVVLEAIDDADRELDVQIFATDIDIDALGAARHGIYPASSVERLGPERIDRFFVPLDGHGYKVGARLRDRISFAVQDLCNDPPFSRMHLVICRNVLIYLRREVQANVFRLLHFALRPGGFLFLGCSESLGTARDYLAAVSATWRIFRRVGASRPGAFPAWRLGNRDTDEPRRAGPRLTGRVPRRPLPEPSIAEMARDAILDGYVPPSVVVGADGRVVYVHGDISPYMRLAAGEPRLDLMSMLHAEMRTRVRAALYKSRRDQHPVVVRFTPERPTGDRAIQIQVSVRPLDPDSLGEGCLLVAFEHVERPLRPDAEADPEEAGVAEHLEQELHAIREDLRSTVEELEISNEELRASHEESLSMNEELQSANEELEATTEELRSLNEELTTVNQQLKEKIGQVQAAHDDLQNFFASTKLATIFLDEALCIERYTPSAGQLLRLDQSDIGRPLTDLNRPLLTPTLAEQARQVLDRLSPIEREVATDDDRWFIQKALPYRTEHNRIEGVVLTFTEISDLKRVNRRLATRERQQAVVARLGMQALAEHDLDALLDRTVRQVAHTLEADFAKVLELDADTGDFRLRAGVGWKPGAVGDARIPGDRGSQAGYTLHASEVVIVDLLADEERFHGPALLVDHDVHSGMSCTIQDHDGPYGVLGVHTRRRREFTPDDANFLQAIANVLSIAIGRRHTDRKLKLAETRLSLALDASQAGVFEYAIPERQVIYVSDRWAAIFGYRATELPPPEHLAPWILARVHPDDEERRRLDLARFLDADAPRHSQRIRMRHRDGHWIHVEIAAVVTRRDDAAQPTHLTGVLSDITERELARERLRQSEERFRVAMLNAPVLFYTLDPGLRVTWMAGPHAARWDRDHVIGNSEAAFLPFETANRLAELHDRVRRTARGTRGEITMPADDGETVFDVVVEPLREDGAVIGLTVCAFDITTRKRAEEGLRESEGRHRRQAAELNMLYDTAPIGLALFDTELRMMRVNRRLAEYNGLPLDLQGGRRLAEFLPDIARTIEPLLRQVIASRRPLLGIEITGRTPAQPDRERYWKVSLIPIFDADARVEAVSAFVENIDDRKAQERALTDAAHHKDRFLAMLGHELRNPLAIIRTSVALQRALGGGDERLDETVQLIDRQVTHITRLVDDLLDVSRIARGKIRLQLQRLELSDCVRTVCADLRPTVETDGNRSLVVDLESGGIWVEGDPTRLAQALGNLVHNAVKFTAPDGHIIVRLVIIDREARLSVIDDGIGIEPDLIDAIFEPFRQTEQGIDRARGGLGLGLSLVKGIVELHLGRIEVETGAHGTAFHISLPLVGVPSRSLRPVRSPPSAGRDVLLVEDHPDTRAMVKAALELKGHTVALARSARDALEVLDDWRPDIVICDVGLPGELDGHGFARAVRADPRHAGIYLVALTGYAGAADRERAHRAGFDLHIAKPADLERLDAIVREAPRRERHPH